MRSCEISDNEDLEVKQEPMDNDKVIQSDDSPPGSESGDPHNDSQDTLADAQFQTVPDSGKLYVMEFRISGEHKLFLSWLYNVHVYIQI